jgi:signal transduction histidine kinase
MRLLLRSTALLLLAYGAAVTGLAWWANAALAAASAAVMDDTAHLVAIEVAAALDDEVVAELLEGTPANRIRLLNQIYDLTRRSAMVRTVEVVDATGEVFASDRFEAVGAGRATPSQVFADSRQPRLMAEPGPRLRPRHYVLAMPLARQGELLGYLRLGLDSSRLARLHDGFRRRILIGAAAGLVLVAAVVAWLHYQLRRRTRQLVAALEGAAGGVEPPARPVDEDFAPALAVAGRLGRELKAERSRSEQAGRRLLRLAQMLDVGLLLLSREREVEFASERAHELFGLPPTAGADAWRPVLAPLEGILQRATVERTSGGQADLEVGPPGKPRRIRCQIYLLDEEGTAGTLVQARDRDLLQAIETDLRLAAQLRALMRIYRGVAHDLRAPLNAMVLNLELLKRSLDPAAPPRPELPDKQQRWIVVIEQELQRLRRALDVLLAQTAPSSESAERFDVRDVLEEIHALLYPQARQQGVEIQVEVPESSVPVVAFRDQVKQAVLNIAINALEAMPEGGRLTLSLEADAGSARIRVSDTGPGIPSDLADRIFDMHFTTKQSGTGIGLYVARSMFEAQGGTVQTVRTGPAGTTFQLTLPLPERGS